MINKLQTILLILITVFTYQVFACSFPFGYYVGEPYTDVIKPSGKKPAPPEVSKVTLIRGSDDGNPASCSDAGILEIVLENTTKFNVKSYEIKLLNGKFPDHVIPDSFITPVRLKSGKKGFMLVWLDMPAGVTELEPIDAVLEIRQLTYGNHISKPKVIRVTDKSAANKALNKDATDVAPIS